MTNDRMTCGMAQIFIIEFGGPAFSTASLDIDHWIWCVLFGAGELLWGQVCQLAFIIGRSFSFLQRVSIACYAKACTSYRKSVSLSVCLSVRPSVCHSLALCRNVSS